MFFDEALAVRGSFAFGLVVPLVATFGGICAVAYSLRFIHDVFFNGDPVDLPQPQPHEPPLFMKAPVALLVLLCLAVGVLPTLTFGPIVHLAATAMLGAAPPPNQLALWHGLNGPLAMSAVALLGGIGFYRVLRRGQRLHRYQPRGLTGSRLFTQAIDGLFAAADRVTAALDTGSLQRHLAVLMVTAVLLAAGPFASAWGTPGWPATGTRVLLPSDALSVAVWGLLLATGAALVLGHHDRVRAVVLVGVVGLVTSLAFVALSAPDLPLTQLTVELASTVLLLMALALLPPTSPRESSVARRWRDAALALAGGAGMAGLSWLVLTRDFESISWFFLGQAGPQGGRPGGGRGEPAVPRSRHCRLPDARSGGAGVLDAGGLPPQPGPVAGNPGRAGA